MPRIPFYWPMNNRDGTFDKDVRRKNVMFEKDLETVDVLKRPGTSAIVYDGVGGGQGLGMLNDILFGVSGDSLQILTAPPNSGANGTAFNTPSLNPQPWSGRYLAGGVVFKGRMWILAGLTGAAATNIAGDVWSSQDGITWTASAGSAPWAGRYGFGCCVCNERIYIAGGQGPVGTYLNDVWSTEDGTNWVLETAAAPWNTRYGHSLTASSSGMFLIGGANNFFAAHDDVWFSADGKNWARVGGPFGWGTRVFHGCVYFKSKLYIIGGQNIGGVAQNNVWSSPNGLVWTQETAAAFAAGRILQACCVYADRMWAIGGAVGGAGVDTVYMSPTNGTGAWTLQFTGWIGGLLAGSNALVFSEPPNNLIPSTQYRFPTIWVLNGTNNPVVPAVFLTFAQYATLNTVLGGTTALNPPIAAQPFTFNSFNNSTRLLVKCESALYVYDAGTINRVVDAGYPAITVPGLVVLGGFAYVMDKSGLIYNCALDNPYYWPALNVLGADYEEDRGVALLKYLNYVVALGESTIQIFYDAGLQFGSPLKPYLNANARIGCCNKYSAMRVGNNIVWLSQTAERRWQVMVLDGVSPKAISTPYIEKILERQAFALSFARGFVVEVPGHLFYGLAFGIGGTASYSLVYDFSSGEWMEWSKASGAPVFFTGSTPVSSAGSNASNLVQDFVTGVVRSIDSNIYQDDGTTPFPVYQRTGKVDFGNNRLKTWGRMDVIGDQNGSTPTISYTDDDYQTYSTPRTVDMSSLRPVLFRNGASRRRAFVYEQLDNQPMRIQAIEHDAAQGT